MVHTENRQYLIEAYHEIVNGKDKKEVEFRLMLPEKNLRWIMVYPIFINGKNDKGVLIGSAEDYLTGRIKMKICKLSQRRKILSWRFSPMI